MRACVGHGILDGLAIAHLVPFSIDEDIGQVQCHGQIHILADDVVVVAAVVVGPIHPCHYARLNPGCVCEFRGFRDVCHEGGFHDIGQGSHDNDAPGRVPAASGCGVVLVGAYAIELAVCVVAQR